MSSRKSISFGLGMALVAGLVSACADTGTSAGAVSLTIMGAAGAPPTAVAPSLSGHGPFGSPPDTTLLHGDPASLTIGMYGLWISTHDDCSSPMLVDDNGTTAVDKDLAVNPVLFTGNPPDGSYRCVMIKMSDVLRMVPDSSFGSCVAGTEYSGDIYREGQSDWKDVNGNTIIGTGTDSLPVDDHVTIFMTRDTTAAIARGISTNQTIALGSDLVVPTASTFYWNGTGSVVSGGGQCGINPGNPSFQ
jgi:hypothetical protein